MMESEGSRLRGNHPPAQDKRQQAHISHMSDPTPRLCLIIGLFAALLAAALGVCGIRSAYEKAEAAAPTPPPPPTAAMVKRWIEAIKNNNPRMALLAASQMTSPDKILSTPPKYIGLASAENVNSQFFNATFSPLDYLSWRDTLRAKEVADSLVIKSDEAPQMLFNAIKKQMKIEKYDQDNKRPTFPMEAWDKGKGDVIDMCLLAAGLGLQVGCDAQAVFLFDKETGKGAQLLCLIVGQSQVCLCDFIGGKMWRAKSWVDLVQGRVDDGVVMSGSAIKVLKEGVYATLALAPDYKTRNQELYKQLCVSGMKGLPIFAVDPDERQGRFTERGKIHVNPDQLTLWPTAFEIIKQSPIFPRQWQKK